MPLGYDLAGQRQREQALDAQPSLIGRARATPRPVALQPRAMAKSTNLPYSHFAGDAPRPVD